MKRPCIIGGHGLGDNILALQCASIAVKHDMVDVFSSSRKEIFNPLQYAFKNIRTIVHLDENISENNNFLNKPELTYYFKENYSNVYYVIPDLLFSNPYAFDWRKYNVHPQTIRSIRLLTDEWRPEKIIYVGLCTSTEGYLYYNIPHLLVTLGEAFQDYTIYFPNVKKWAGKDLDYYLYDIQQEAYPKNVFIHEDPKFEDSIDWLKKSSYAICADNGISHLAYQYGIPRLLLDPRIKQLPWVARWREDLSESIPINSCVDAITRVVKSNLELPQTCLLPRYMMANGNQTEDWKKDLIFKY